MALLTHRGSCHGGAVRFEVDADLEAGTLRCNCSICRKTRAWLALVPADRFRLLAGEEMLADYRFGPGSIRHRFCRSCGVRPFGMSTDGRSVAVQITCLDDLSPEQLAALPIVYVDGANDRFDRPPALTSWL